MKKLILFTVFVLSSGYAFAQMSPSSMNMPACDNASDCQKRINIESLQQKIIKDKSDLQQDQLSLSQLVQASQSATLNADMTASTATLSKLNPSTN